MTLEQIKCHSSDSAIYAWNGGAYDRRNHTLYFPAGGGHADYGGNEIYTIDLAVLKAARIGDPQPLTGSEMIDGCPRPYAGPPAVHSYDGVLWVPDTDEILLFGSVPYCRHGMVNAPEAWSYRPASNTWTPLPELNGFSRFARTDIATNGDILVFSRNTLFELDPRSKALKRQSRPGPDLGEGNAVLDPTRNQFYMSQRGGLWMIDLKPEAIPAPVRVAELAPGMDQKWGMAYHPPTDQLVFWDGGARVAAFSLATRKWSEMASPPPTPTNQGRGVYSRWLWLSDPGVFAGFNNVDEGLWLYRPAGDRDLLSSANIATAEPQGAENTEATKREDQGARRGQKTQPAGSEKTATRRPAVAASYPRASFEERCSAPGVVLCDPLDTGRIRGVGVSPSTPCADGLPGEECKYRSWRWMQRASEKVRFPPSLDKTVKASGSGSLKFTIGSRSDANDSGYFQTNFTPDSSAQFGEGETFFVQWRQRFSRDMLFDENGARRQFRVVKGGGSGGFKTVIINAGDHKDLPYPVDSCTNQHLVMNNGGQTGAILMYHSCGWYEGVSQYHGLIAGGRGQVDKQPGGVNQCWWLDPSTGAVLSEAWQDCELFWPDEWMTFQVQVSVGKWVDKRKSAPPTSNIKLWVAREGKPSRLIIDHDLDLRKPEQPFMKYGKVWLLPYHTNKDPSEEHPEAYTWYDELIVSRSRIADPSQ